MNHSQLMTRKLLVACLMGSALAGHSLGQNPGGNNSAGFANPPYNAQPNLPQATVKPTPLPSTASFQVYDIPKEMSGSVAAQLQLVYANQDAVRITTEPESGRLVVYAPASLQQDVAFRIGKLQQEINANNRHNGEITHQKAYKLHHISPIQLEEAVKRLSGTRAIINTVNDVSTVQLSTELGLIDVMQIDRRAAEVFVKGTPSRVYSWMQVVTAIDGGQVDSQDRPTRIVPVAPADPIQVEKAVRIYQASYKKQPPDDQTLEVTDLGQPPANSSQAIVNMQDLSQESGLLGDVQIEFVPELGLVILKGNKKDVQRVLEVIEKIKKQSQETKPVVEVYPLKHVDSQALETVVTNLYNQVLAQRQGQISITALNQPNSLLLIGQKEAVDSLRELLVKLDQPLDPNSQLRVFRMIHASARDAETTIRNFFVDQPGNNNVGTGRAGLATRVRVVADYRTNSLIIQASPRDLQEVTKLVQELDVESTPAQNEIRVFTLSNALADNIVSVLTAAISGQASSSGNSGGQGGAGGQAGGGGLVTTGDATPPSGKLQIKRAEGMIDSGILAGIVVTANPSINAVVVRAPSKSMPLIEALIKELDQAPSAEAQIKVFEVKRGDATALASVIQQLFGLPATAGTNTNGGFLGLGAQNLSQLSAGGENTLVQLRVTVDTRTNSIIASGSPRDLDVMEVLLWRLDEEGVQNRTTEVIWLRNSNATDIATSIQNFLTQQRQTINQVLFTNQAIPTEQVDREVLVVAEPSTNSLIVSASPRYAKQIREVIERLDRRPPLIMVQILLAEVELSDTFELGTELGLQDALNFDRGTATGGTLSSTGFNINGPLTNTITTGRPDKVAPNGLSTFGLARANQSLGYGGLVLSAASDTVNVLFRALQDANRIQLLSRPQVMTIDNVEAFVQVGFQVPRVTSVTNGINGNAINTEDASVGLLMRLQPRTNQDGMILMNVSVERSAVGDEATGIPIGFGPNGDVIRSPIISRTLAQTRVTAFDGQTVVFAGLITKNRTSRSRRIPFLSSVPLIGPLFRFDTETERRTELLVVMTPHIVRSPEDMEVINAVESARMSWCLADILNIHGDTSLSQGNGLWGPATSPIIYPDESPMGIDGMMIPSDSILLNSDNQPLLNIPSPSSPSDVNELSQPLVPAPLENVPSLDATSLNRSQPGSNVVPASSQQPSGYPNLIRPASTGSPTTNR